MQLEQRRQTLLQLHLSDQQFYQPLRCTLYWRFDSKIKIQEIKNLNEKLYKNGYTCKVKQSHENIKFGNISTKLGELSDCIAIWQLDMSTARQRLKSPRSLSGTSAHPIMVTLVNIMVMNGSLTSFSFHVNQPPHSWDIAISDSNLETPRSRSWVWSRGNVIQLAQYHINSHPFHFTSIRPTIPEIQLFRNLTLKHPRSRSWVRSKVKVTYYTQYRTDAHQPDQPFPRYGQYSVRPWKNISKITVFNRTPPKSNQVITTARAIKLPL